MRSVTHDLLDFQMPRDMNAASKAKMLKYKGGKISLRHISPCALVFHLNEVIHLQFLGLGLFLARANRPALRTRSRIGADKSA